MKFNIKIERIQTSEEIADYWQDQDYINLLELFNFPEADTVKPENLKEMLHMAITDFEPVEAAAILLNYKLSDRLNEGQIAQISHDMQLDKVSEEYPEIDLHYPLFNINQLLYKAYNGKFPNTKATLVDFSMQAQEGPEQDITKEMVLKCFNNGISDRNLIRRLFADQMSTEKEFVEAEAVLWDLKKTDASHYSLITSAYWLSEADFSATEFEGECLDVGGVHLI